MNRHRNHNTSHLACLPANYSTSFLVRTTFSRLVLRVLRYSNTQIQKMGRWKGATFKEYIREELACYLEGMTKNMKRNFKFVNISGNAYHNVTAKCFEEDYNINSR